MLNCFFPHITVKSLPHHCIERMTIRKSIRFQHFQGAWNNNCVADPDASVESPIAYSLKPFRESDMCDFVAIEKCKGIYFSDLILKSPALYVSGNNHVTRRGF